MGHSSNSPLRSPLITSMACGEGLYGPKRGTARFGIGGMERLCEFRRYIVGKTVSKTTPSNVGTEILNETSRGITAFVSVRRCTNHNHNLSTVSINRAVIVLPELGQGADPHAHWKAADR